MCQTFSKRLSNMYQIFIKQFDYFIRLTLIKDKKILEKYEYTFRDDDEKEEALNFIIKKYEQLKNEYKIID